MRLDSDEKILCVMDGKRNVVLIFTPDLTPSGIENGRGVTGFSLMVDEYARLLARHGKVVRVSCSSLKNPDLKIGDEYLLLERSLWQIARHARPGDWKHAFLYFLASCRLSRSARWRIFKQRLSTGLYVKQIRRSGAEVVFLQSFLPHIMPFVGAALHEKVPMALACHQAYDDRSPLFANYEGAFARYAVAPMVMNGIPVSGVGSGIARYFRQHVPECYWSRLHVIGNPVPEPDGMLGRKKDSGLFTIVVSGNIGERKNQSQVLRALACLPAEERGRLQVIFIGDDSTHGRIRRQAVEAGVERLCRFMGRLSREETLRVTAGADLVLSATRSEGFGLPFIEGFSFGIPAVFFADIDAAAELGDPKCAVLVRERGDEALAEGILQAMRTEWDREHIRRSVREKFGPQAIAGQHARLLGSASVPSLSEKRWDRMMLAYLRNKDGRFYPASDR